MATPIQYVPQFIPTNVGLMNQQLGQMQQRYDQAIGNIGQMEDMFAQMPVHPTDIAGKQAILGDFQGRIQKIVDRFGGDYGAASKDIVREISKTRQDPFFKLAPYKMSLAEEQRRAQKQLGLNYIPVKDISSVQIYNPATKEYASSEDLNYDYLDRGQLQKRLQEQYAALGSQSREQSLVRNEKYPWMLEEKTYKGLYPSEVEGKANEMYRSLINENPNIPQDVAAEISSNYARQLMQGWSTQRITDPTYKDGAGTDPGFDPSRLPYFVEPGIKKESNVDVYSGALNEAINADIDVKSSSNVDINKRASELGIDPEKIESDLSLLSKSAEENYNKAIGKFRGLDSFNYLTKVKKVSELDAAKIVVDNQIAKSEAGVFGNVYYPTDITDLKPKVIRGFTGDQAKQFPLYKQTEDGLEKETKFWSKDPGVQEKLSNIEDIGFDYEEGHVVLKTSDDGEFETYRVPFDAIGNIGVKQSLNNFGKFIKAYSGELNPGLYKLGSDDDPKYIMEVVFNDKTKAFDKTIHKIIRDENNNLFRIPNVPIQVAMKEASEELFDYYGEQPEYVVSKGARTRTR